jgi:hypothetical protein
VILTADGVAEALAPVLVGRLRDVSGSYATGFSTLIGFAIAGAIAVMMLPRPRGTPNPAPLGAPAGARAT